MNLDLLKFVHLLKTLSKSLRLLPPANEVCEGYVFTGVCLSTGGQYVGRYTPRQVHSLPRAGTPPGRYPPTGIPPGRYIPLAGTPPAGTSPQMYTPQAVHAGRYGQQAGGTYPTGKHSCLFMILKSITDVIKMPCHCKMTS